MNALLVMLLITVDAARVKQKDVSEHAATKSSVNGDIARHLKNTFALVNKIRSSDSTGYIFGKKKYNSLLRPVPWYDCENSCYTDNEWMIAYSEALPLGLTGGRSLRPQDFKNAMSRLGPYNHAEKELCYVYACITECKRAEQTGQCDAALRQQSEKKLKDVLHKTKLLYAKDTKELDEVLEYIEKDPEDVSCDVCGSPAKPKVPEVPEDPSVGRFLAALKKKAGKDGKVSIFELEATPDKIKKEIEENPSKFLPPGLELRMTPEEMARYFGKKENQSGPLDEVVEHLESGP